MANPPPGGNWKHTANKPATGASPASAAGSAPTSRRTWMPGGAVSASVVAKKSSRGQRFLIAGTLTALMIALIVFVIWLLRPQKPVELLLVTADSADTLAQPEHLTGPAGFARIADWASRRGDKSRLAGTVAETAGDGWKSRLNADARSVLVYFSLPGGNDADGPYLWQVPPVSLAPTEANKLRVRDILARLEALPASQPKWLIFDAAQSPPSWAHGHTHHDFARGLKSLDDAIAKVPGLAVICAADENQRSWVSEEWRESVFNHFLVEALRGAVGKNGDRITGGACLDYVTAEVNRWALANRDEPQSVIVLPRADGRERANRLEPSDVPPSGYGPPPPIEAPSAVAGNLVAAWKSAESLAGLAGNADPAAASPDTLDPVKWREYLDSLLRWERQVRVGSNSEVYSRRVATLADELRSPIATDSLAVSAAVPVGRALGMPAQPANADGLARLWSPPEGSTRVDEWSKLRGLHSSRMTSLRLEVSAFVLAQVMRDGPNADVLKQADDVLALVDGGQVAPAETHFLRMLHRHLHPTLRPPVELLRDAIELRIAGERAAWFGDQTPVANLPPSRWTEPTTYPHSEVVHAWVRGSIEKGDAERSVGQDLLFHTAVESWGQARIRFQRAHTHYEQAAKDAKALAGALAPRDRVFARLPYYARWLAEYRGPRPAAEIESLVALGEQAAQTAHELDRILSTIPEPDQLAPRLEKLITLTAQARDAFDRIVRAFDEDVAALGNTVHPSNWHAIDSALSVPFIPADRRVQLLTSLRSISYQLATKSEQPQGSAPPQPAVRLARARAHARLALRMLGSDDALAGVSTLLTDANPASQWDSLRDAGQRIGQRYRAIPQDAAAEWDRAATLSLPAARPHLARAALLARVHEPACQLRAGESPVAAAQRHRRHDLLLWQAERTTREGWADVGPGPPDQWYARKTATLFTRSAESLILNGATNLSTDDADRLLADCRRQSSHTPTVLNLVAPATRDLTDKPQWDFNVMVGRTPGTMPKASIGYPVLWLNLPGPPFTTASAPDLPRKVLRELAEGAESARDTSSFVATISSKNPTGKLDTNVLYRGHIYQKTTTIRLAGAPTLEWVYQPPSGPAAFAVIADDSLVNGAVTLLIDLSKSMEEPLTAKQTKLEVLHEALEKVLEGLPPKTVLTVAFFWGENNLVRVEALPEISKLTWSGDRAQIRAAMKAVKAKAPTAGANTPLALGVQKVLSRDETAYWPRTTTGIRTLVVLTDGADNHSKDDAGTVVRKALLDSTDDTSLHLLFFAIPGDEKAIVSKQYEILDDAEPFRQKLRTPPAVWPDVSTAEALTNRLQQSMLPRILYRQEETARGSRSAGLLRVTLPREVQVQPTPALEHGVYNLYGLRANQQLQLEPGDRVLLRARGRERDAGFDLEVPPHAYDLAGKLGRPRVNAQIAGKPSLYMTVPELTSTDLTGWCDMHLSATLEPGGSPDVGPLVRMPRPLFAWFDVAHAEGGPANGLTPRVRITNRPGLLSQTWNIDVKQWDPNSETARMPRITAAWVEGKPGGPARFSIGSLNNIEREFEKMPKTATLAGTTIRLEDLSIEEMPKENDRPAGQYLTVRINYDQPGKFVFLRPGAMKGPRQMYLLHERHLYFDASSLYTARFGPLTPDDTIAGVELELYSVADIVRSAQERGRATTLLVENKPQNRKLELPAELRLDPAGK